MQTDFSNSHIVLAVMSASVLILSASCTTLAGEDRSLGFHRGLTLTESLIPSQDPVLSPLRADGTGSQAGCSTCAH